MKIRSDLDGVVYAQSEGGVVCLSAGDTVPDGVEVGDHLLDGEKGSDGDAGVKRGRRSTSRPDADD